MAPATRGRVLVFLALTVFACAVGFAVADSIKVNAPRTDDSQPETYGYVEGGTSAPGGPTGGEIGACVNGEYYGGRGEYQPPATGGGEPFVGADCGGRTGDTTLPDDVTGCNTVEECQEEHGGGGGGGPAPPCNDQASCETLVMGVIPDDGGGGGPALPCDDPASCEELVTGLLAPPGGGPAPPCSDQASCQALVEGVIPDGGGGAPGAPTMRDCAGASGGEATCFDFGDGNYLVGDSPDDGQGELGFCTSSGYYYVAGPSNPDGNIGATCPGGGAPVEDPGDGDGDGGGGGPAPPCSDQASCQALVEGVIPAGGGGAPGAPTMRDCTSSIGGEATCFDFGDGNYLVGDSPDDGQGELGFCTSSGYYYVSGPAPDGDAGAECPGAAPADGGGDPGGEPPPPPPSNGGGTTTTQPRPAEQLEVPRIEITRDLRRVSRRGYVRIPLACRTVRTACVGVMRLRGTRRRRDGRRVHVLLAEARFHVGAGDTATRRIRLTRAGRLLLAAREELRANARMALRHADGTTVQRDRVVLRAALS